MKFFLLPEANGQFAGTLVSTLKHPLKLIAIDYMINQNEPVVLKINRSAGFWRDKNTAKITQSGNFYCTGEWIIHRYNDK